jgi:CTP synthase (UTP-ammonia lyase)
MQGALEAIRHARESRLPFLGTCGGFQHALVEFARNVAGIPAADHAESSPDAAVPVVTLLCCSLVGASGEIHFTPGSRLAAIFNGNSTVGEYRCSYGLNPDYRARLEEAGLRFSGFDADEEIRALELPSHPFFIGTLFQPERSSFSGKAHPLVTTFVEAVVGGGIDA